MVKSKRITARTVIEIIGVLIILLLLYLNFKPNKELYNINAALNDSLSTWVDKYGHARSRISILETSNTKQFLKLKSKDSTIVKLQKEVAKAKKEGKLNEPGSSLSIIGTKTKANIAVPTEISYEEKTNDSTPQFPIYKSKFNLEGWVFGTTIAKQDSTILDIQVKDEFVFSLDYEPQGFLGLGKAKPFAEITSKNPYSAVKEFRTYQVDAPKKPVLVIGPSIGYGLMGARTGLIVGVTATYPLVRIRL